MRIGISPAGPAIGAVLHGCDLGTGAEHRGHAVHLVAQTDGAEVGERDLCCIDEIEDGLELRIDGHGRFPLRS